MASLKTGPLQLYMSTVEQHESGNWFQCRLPNSCLLRTAGACCSSCLPLLICPPHRDTTRNSPRQVRQREREHAYFVSVRPEIAQAVHPTPACCGDWCRGSDVEYVVRWRSPDRATRHQSHLSSAVQPAAGLVSTGHKIELLVCMCIFSMLWWLGPQFLKMASRYSTGGNDTRKGSMHRQHGYKKNTASLCTWMLTVKENALNTFLRSQGRFLCGQHGK